MVALGEVMSTDLRTTAPETPVAEAAASMVGARVGSSLVMTGQVLVAIITERDVLRAAASGRDLQHEPVRNWMTEDPVTVPPDTDSEAACETMLSGGFHHLPVVADRQVVGIVTMRDLLSVRIHRHV